VFDVLATGDLELAEAGAYQSQGECFQCDACIIILTIIANIFVYDDWEPTRMTILLRLYN
jgi:hypothetical protein